MTWIGLLLLIIHILACSGLILIVLLQAGKGASLGAAFGGGASQTVFGARSATLIGRLTWVLAAAFMSTSLLLAIVSPWGKTAPEAQTGILHEETVPRAPESSLPSDMQQGVPEQFPAGEPAGGPVVPGASPSGENAAGPVEQDQQAQPVTNSAPAEGQSQPERKPQQNAQPAESQP